MKKEKDMILTEKIEMIGSYILLVLFILAFIFLR
jgi:hypothetical protein